MRGYSRAVAERALAVQTLRWTAVSFQSFQKTRQLRSGQQGSQPKQEDGPPPAPVLRHEEQMKQAEGQAETAQLK